MSDIVKEKEKVIARAKSAVENMLSELKIDRICYVDDKCSINELKGFFIGNLISLHAKKPEEELFVDWKLAKPVFENRIKSLWDNATEEGKRELYLKLLKFLGDEEGLSNSVAPLRLKKHLKKKIDLFSPTEWIKAKDEIARNINEESKILCLFDIDFGNAPLEDGRDGRDLAAEMLSNPAFSDFIYCGIFSHLFSIEEENDKRDEYCDSHQLNKEKFYTISKKRFVDDSYLPGLAEGIKNTLRINEVEALKKISTKTLKASFKKSINEIKGLKPDSFNHIIQKSSRKEGIWEVFTLIRLNNILTTKTALQSFVPKKIRTKINKKLERIRSLERIKTGAVTPTDSSETNIIRQKELYLEPLILNSLHFPISNGDIFKIKNKEYVLLAQPCNLMLREKGYRGSKSRDYNIGFLLAVDLVSKETYKTYSKGQLNTMYVLEDKVVDENSHKVVKFSTFKTVSLFPLDLVVFNTNGKSEINLLEKESTSTTIQESWKKRYKIIYEVFSKYKKSVALFKRLKSKDKDDLKETILYGEMFKGYDIDNENILKSKSQKLGFDIERISRFEDPFAMDLLQNFMYYLSRNAFDHNFTENVK